MPHDYMLSLLDLASGGRPIIFYEQVAEHKSSDVSLTLRQPDRMWQVYYHY